MTLGEIVKHYRQEHHYSMDEFAQKCGLSKGYISMLEKNENPRSKKPIIPSLETIKQVAQAINTDLDSLIRQLDSNQEIALVSETEYANIGYPLFTRIEIANTLKKLRIVAGMTQIEVAKLIGRKQQTIAAWETGQSQPDLATFFHLCTLYRASIDEIFMDNGKNIMSYSSESLVLARAYDRSDLKSKNIARQALDLPPLPTTPAKDMEASTDFDIEQELADYRRELEAEQKGRMSAASDDTKGA